MKAFYDLHIHSALSPCADADMTPNNIVNMALLKGLDVIAVTDHNSCGNLRAVTEVAGDNLLVIPGIEVETAEEVHVLCYFPTVEAAEAMEGCLREHRLPIRNKPEIFGHQWYMNREDEVVGEEEHLLVSATQLSIGEVFRYTAELGGTAVPAHIDRSSYSVISNLGFLPSELLVTAVEITERNRDLWESEWGAYTIITNSDAHQLGFIAEPVRCMDIRTKSAMEILDRLTNKKR